MQNNEGFYSMDSPIEYLKETWTWVVNNTDPRVEHWPLMSSFWPLFIFLSLYVYFCTTLGPRLMKDRKPFDLKIPSIVYNSIQIIFNGFFVFEGFRQVWLPGKYNVLCEKVAYDREPFSMLIASYVYFYFLLKALDLIDTVIMVLRKKDRQISFLHLYHHTGMVAASWIGVKFLAGGHVIFFGTINCAIHVIMYSYYLFTAVSPKMKKSIWWKRHLTELQLVQFIIVAMHCVSGIVYPECRFPKLPLVVFGAQNIFMFLLFWDFYVKSYLKAPKDKNNVKNE